MCLSLVIGIPWIFVGLGAAPSAADDGTNLRTITAQNYSCSVGTGLAFDGTNLLLSCNYDNNITAVSPVDGSFVRSYSISGVSAIGALAWDRGRQILWACGGFGGDDTIVYKISLVTRTATEAFGGTGGCPDGLAFDGTDDTLYLSADVATTVQHYKVDGTLIGTIDVAGKLGGCGNSGIAVGGSYLFLANNGCSQIYRAAKPDVSAPVLFGSYPARLEDMECDDLTFRSSGKAAIWSKDAYDGVLNAFELNVGDCGFGGLPPGSEDADTDGDGLPDSWENNGVDVDHDGKIDLDIKAMGADPKHKDIFIETDWMAKPKSCIWFICWGGRSFAPQQAALNDVRAAFAAAPVGNPDGTTGIRAHIDSGSGSVMNPLTGATWGGRSAASEVPFKEILGSSDSNGYNWLDFDSIKNVNFSINRRNVFHYLLYADMYQGSPSKECPSGRCSSGISRGIPASDVIVTDGHDSWGDGFTRIQERGTVMHETGHNLNLHHGGGEETNNWNPAYRSVMNYAYQLIGLPPGNRLDYSRSTPYIDWDHLVFTGGSVGSFGAALPTTTDHTDELDPATAKAANAFATDGDGTVKYVGPTLLLANGGAQQLGLDVMNIGKTPTTYTVRADAPGMPLVSSSTTVTVPPGATRRAYLPVNVAQLRPGTYQVNAQLSSGTAGAELSTDRATAVVPDLTDPAQVQQARDALARLRGLPHDAGLDDATREALLAALVTALPWQASVAMTGAPANKLTATHTTQSPTFTPDRTSRQAISIASWPNTRALALSLNRVQRTSAAYKGTLHIQRPNGTVVDATVSLVWNPNTNTLQGSYTSTSGGGNLTLVLTSP